MKKAVDLYMVYRFLRLLSLPFNEWKSFRTGVIDKNGEILIPKGNRTQEQNDSFSKFDLLVLKMKKMLGKLPGGKTKMASYIAALWLIKEQDCSLLLNSLNEDMNISEPNLLLFHERYLYYTSVFESVNGKITEDGETPTVSVGGGDVAGLGVGLQGEPGLTRTQQKKHRTRAMNTSLVGRNITSVLMDEYYTRNPKRLTPNRRRRHTVRPVQEIEEISNDK